MLENGRLPIAILADIGSSLSSDMILSEQISHVATIEKNASPLTINNWSICISIQNNSVGKGLKADNEDSEGLLSHVWVDGYCIVKLGTRNTH